jgi:hypothetical protein
MKILRVGDFYNRRDVHGIFSPDTIFTPQAGTWGLQGIVSIPKREGDWVFLVTLGQTQGDHAFDESITTDGVLSWQSQPRQGLENETIKSLIAHDERINNIHLFLRSKAGADYGYFGNLGYLTHDTQRERPVHFQWQLMDWPMPDGFITQVGVELLGDKKFIGSTTSMKVAQGLEFVAKPPPRTSRRGTSTSEFQSRKSPNHLAQHANNTALGLLGEELVLAQEKIMLTRENRSDLAEQVVHVSIVEGDSAGYDIRSFTSDGTTKFIEVKSTKGTSSSPFFISPNEVEFSKRNSDNYYLYRVFELDVSNKSAKVYVIHGDLSKQLDLRPTQFIAELASHE